MTPGAAPGIPIGIERPDWPVPAQVAAAVTTRLGGVSRGPYAGFNLAAHVGDDPQAVGANRRRLAETLDLPQDPHWLRQCHGTNVVELPRAGAGEPQADGAWTARPGVVCAVLTADCLPVLLCDRRGTRVAAVHAGWRGLAAGVLEAAVAALRASMPPAAGDLLAWLGPAIGPDAFEIGEEVRTQLLAGTPGAHDAVRPTGPGRWHADLYALARARLEGVGVGAVYGGGACTVREASRYYSYRRDGTTGRMATLVWMRGAQALA